MPGLLDLLGMGGGVPPLSYPGTDADFSGAPAAPVPGDPAAEAQAAREMAALRLRLGQRAARAGTALQGGPVSFQGGAAGLPEPGGAMGGLAGYPAPAGGEVPGQAAAGSPFAGGAFGSISPQLSGGGEPGAPPVTTSRQFAPGVPGNPTVGRGDGLPDGRQTQPPPLAPPTLDGNVPPSIFSRVGSFLGKNSDALMGAGAGLLSGRGWAPGLSRGFAGLSAGAQSDKAQAAENQTAKFLQQRLGVSAEEAVSIAQNPALLKHNLDYMYAKPVLVKTTDQRGNEHAEFRHPYTGVPVAPPQLPRVRTVAEADALPVGTRFINPQGKIQER